MSNKPKIKMKLSQGATGALCMKCIRLEKQNKAMKGAMREFVRRVEAGEIHSKKTYTEFKAILEEK